MVQSYGVSILRCFRSLTTNMPLRLRVCIWEDQYAYLLVRTVAIMEEDNPQNSNSYQSYELFLLLILQVSSGRSMARALLWLLCVGSQAETISVVEVIPRLVQKLGRVSRKRSLPLFSCIPIQQKPDRWGSSRNCRENQQFIDRVTLRNKRSWVVRLQ